MNDLCTADLDRARQGDVQALDALYRAYGDRVYRLCLGVLGQPADAEDAASDVLLRVLEKASTFGGRSRFSTWVYRLTMNDCLNRLRSRRRGPRALPLCELHEGQQPPSPDPGPLEVSSHAEERDTLHELLERLRPEHRAVLVLREVEGLGYQAIAEVLEIPVGTVMSRLSRGREHLERLAAAHRSQGEAAATRSAGNAWEP